MKQKRVHDMGETWAVASVLLGGEKSREEINEQFRILARRFGIYFHPFSLKGGGGEKQIDKIIEQLVQKRWILSNGKEEERFRLTETGRTEAQVMIRELEENRKLFGTLVKPITASKVTFAVHLLLAAIKLPAALFSGSLSLLNDALDTLLDALSSLVVYLGIRLKRERLSAVILSICMFFTAAFALKESAARMLTPQTATASPLVLLAVGISAGFSALLWLYQRFAAFRVGSLALLAQSTDSKNHLIVAGGVAGSLLASSLGLPIVDLIVGLIVALLIFKGAIELLRDIIQSGGGEETQFSAPPFALFSRWQSKQIRSWLLYLIEEGAISKRSELEEEARISINFKELDQLRALGLDDSSATEETALKEVAGLFDRGLVEQRGRLLVLSTKGRAELDKACRRLLHHKTGQASGIRSQGLALLESIFAITLLPLISLRLPFLRESRIPLPLIAHLFPGAILYILGSIRYRKLERRREGELVQSGIYARQRHPMYGSFLLRWTGAACISGSLYLFVPALLLSISQTISARIEDLRLRKRFGKQWEAYRRAVPAGVLHRGEWIVLLLVWVLFILAFFL